MEASEVNANDACIKLINTLPANITFAAGLYADVMDALDAKERILGQLTPDHCTAMSQTIQDYINNTPNISEYEQKHCMWLMRYCAYRSKTCIPAILLISERMYKNHLHADGDTLSNTKTPFAPGRVVPTQVLHWINFLSDIDHVITMNRLRESGITLPARSSDSAPTFNTNCSDYEARSFFTEHSGLSSLLSRSIIPMYWDEVLKQPIQNLYLNYPTQHYFVRQGNDYSLLLDEELLIVLEIVTPNGMQSNDMCRTNDTYGNLVKGYYGRNYDPYISSGNPNAMVPNRLTTKQINSLTIDDENVDIQVPLGKDYIRKSLHQVAGYMVAHKRKYGVFSSCEMTWFLKMESDGRLLVSPGSKGGDAENSTNSPKALLMSFITKVTTEALQGNSSHQLVIDPASRFFRYLNEYWTIKPESQDQMSPQIGNVREKIIRSMLEAWHVIQQARQQAANNNNENSGGVGASKQARPVASDAAHITNRLANTFISAKDNVPARINEGDCSLRHAAINMLPLQNICIGLPWELWNVDSQKEVFTNVIMMNIHGIPLNLAILDEDCDDSKPHFFNEMEMYKGPLRNLQGLCTPYLFYAGEFSNNRQIIVTLREGMPLKDMPYKTLMQPFMHDAMRRALAILHDHGILHNNISWRAFHMVVFGENVRMYIIGYHYADVLDKNANESAYDFKKEKQRLEDMIKELRLEVAEYDDDEMDDE